MNWLLSKKPFIIGSDSPRWNTWRNRRGSSDFYAADVLMLAPMVKLEEVPFVRCRLTALPLKVSNTCCAPVRVVLEAEK